MVTVCAEVFASAVPTETPQGVAALVRVRSYGFDDALSLEPALVVISVGLQDPGNLGTIVRSAEAFGATGVLLGERTVSQWNWKAIRASAGSVFRLPIAIAKGAGGSLEDMLPKLRGKNLRLIATSSHKGKALGEANLADPLAFFVGAEGTGLPRDLLSKMDEVVVIPHTPQVESLNAGVAASILLYEAARQRQ